MDGIGPHSRLWSQGWSRLQLCNTAAWVRREAAAVLTQLIIAGTRPFQTSYRFDGINVNDAVGGSPGSVTGASLGVDAVQEFSVMTSSYSAEYGRTSGGVVNAVSRSGTNQIHGTAFDFLRNSALDARSFFDG